MTFLSVTSVKKWTENPLFMTRKLFLRFYQESLSNKSRKNWQKNSPTLNATLMNIFATQCRNRNKIYDLKTVSGISRAKFAEKLEISFRLMR